MKRRKSRAARKEERELLAKRKTRAAWIVYADYKVENFVQLNASMVLAAKHYSTRYFLKGPFYGSIQAPTLASAVASIWGGMQSTAFEFGDPDSAMASLLCCEDHDHVTYAILRIR